MTKFWLYNCSRCGSAMDKHDGRTFQEGDLCSQCHGELKLRARLGEMEVFDTVYDALQSPFLKIKFKTAPTWQKRYWCDRLLKSGALKWKINGR